MNTNVSVMEVVEELLCTSKDYMVTAINKGRVFVAYIISAITYLIFPTELFKTSLLMVCIAAMLDVYTKTLVIVKRRGGFIKAVAGGYFTSMKFWDGIKVKLVTYTTLSILTGMSYRLFTTNPIGEGAIVMLSSVVYISLFLREFQSNIENLIEYGADIDWLLDIILGVIERVEVILLGKDRDCVKKKHDKYKEDIQKEVKRKQEKEDEENG